MSYRNETSRNVENVGYPIITILDGFNINGWRIYTTFANSLKWIYTINKTYETIGGPIAAGTIDDITGANNLDLTLILERRINGGRELERGNYTQILKLDWNLLEKRITKNDFIDLTKIEIQLSIVPYRDPFIGNLLALDQVKIDKLIAHVYEI